MIDRKKQNQLYNKFVVRYEQGWSVEKIAENLGLDYYDVVGNEYLGRLNREMASERQGKKIDRKLMYELIHLLEKRYHVGDHTKLSDGRNSTIKFDDRTIPNDDPDFIRLQQVVHANH